MENLTYRIQVTPLDCTGCGSCANVCPAKALDMEPIAVALENHEDEKASYIYSKVTYKTDKMPTNTVKGSQFSHVIALDFGADDDTRLGVFDGVAQQVGQCVWHAFLVEFNQLPGRQGGAVDMQFGARR